MELQQLSDIYEIYVAECTGVIEKAAPTDGLFGLGSDPKRDPCHMRFYEAVEQWSKGFLAQQPGGEDIFRAVRFILEAPSFHEGKPVYWFMFAAHGHCRELIPLLSRAQCEILRGLYDDCYPRRERMPVQKEVYKLLAKGSGRRGWF